VAPSVSWPALDLGGAHQRLKAAEARNDASLAVYDQTVLRALEDLETALVAYRQQQAQLVSLTNQAAASRRAAELARIQYKEGGIDFLVLLDAERTLLAAEDSMTVAETGVNTNVVAIYKALGGGGRPSGESYPQGFSFSPCGRRWRVAPDEGSKIRSAAISRQAGRGGFRLRDPSPDLLRRPPSPARGEGSRSIPAPAEKDYNEFNAVHKNARFLSPPSRTAAH
jgi:hypothetical protein